MFLPYSLSFTILYYRCHYLRFDVILFHYSFFDQQVGKWFKDISLVDYPIYALSINQIKVDPIICKVTAINSAINRYRAEDIDPD